MAQTKQIIHSPMRAFYTVFLAVLIALFFGFGVSAFYTAPKYPEMPVELQQPAKSDGDLTEEQKVIQTKYDSEQKSYSDNMEKYSRNVSVITLILSIFALALSLTVISNVDLISDGLLFGGLLTLLYSIIRGFASSDVKYSFMVVSVGLIIAVVLGYIKFIKPSQVAENSKR